MLSADFGLLALVLIWFQILVASQTQLDYQYTECIHHQYKAVCLRNPSKILTLENKTLNRFPDLQNCDCVNLARNQIDSFPANLSTLNFVVTLDLSRNVINKLPDNLNEMSQLEILDISNNLLDTLSTSTRYPASLRGLILKGNKMRTIPAGIKIPGLFILDLSMNQFSDIPEHFCVSDQIIRVDFTENPMNHDVSYYLETVNRCQNINKIPFCLFTDNDSIKCECKTLGIVMTNHASFCMGTNESRQEIECASSAITGIAKGQKLFDINMELIKKSCSRVLQELEQILPHSHNCAPMTTISLLLQAALMALLLNAGLFSSLSLLLT